MRFHLILASLFLAAASHAVPTVVTYSATLERDGAPVDGTVSATFVLFDDDTAGTEVWSETASSIAVTSGELVHELGSIEVLDDSVLAEAELFLEVTVNGDALVPRAAIRSVPFALRAGDAERVGGVAASAMATDAEVSAAVAGRVVTFSQLQGVPNGLADGDNDTVATAAAAGGLAVTSNAFSIAAKGVDKTRIGDEAVTLRHFPSDGFFFLREMPKACGGGLVNNGFNDTTPTCKSLMCGISAGAPLFFQCAGANPACTATSAQTCDAAASTATLRVLNQFVPAN